MLTNIEVDVLQVRLPGLQECLWQDLQGAGTALRCPAATVENQVSSEHTNTSSHPDILPLPCAPLHSSICYFSSGKGFGPFQSYVSAMPRPELPKNATPPSYSYTTSHE